MVSLAANMNILRLNDINGVLDARLNILHFEIGVIIPNNGCKRNRFPDQFENRLHRNARPGNTWFPKMNFGADLNSIHVTNLHHSGDAPQAAVVFRYPARRQHRKRCGNCQISEGPMKNNPTAKQPALAFTGKGASLIFPKNHLGLRGNAQSNLGRIEEKVLPEKAAEREPTALAGPACMSGRAVK